MDGQPRSNIVLTEFRLLLNIGVQIFLRYFQVQRTLAIPTLFVTKDFAVKTNLLL